MGRVTLASGGKFSSSDNHAERQTSLTQNDASGYNQNAYYYWAITSSSNSWDESLSDLRRQTTESGNYFDAPLAFGLAVRVQSGEYQTTESHFLTKRGESMTDVDRELLVWGGGWETYDATSDYRDTTTSQTEITGAYGPGGISESRDDRKTILARYNSDSYDDRSSGFWYDNHSRYTLQYNNENGTITGHVYHRDWTIDDEGTTENIDPIIDHDLDVAGPVPQKTEQPYTPGTIEVGIAEAAVTNLLPGGQQLNALSNLLNPVLLAMAAIGQLKAEPTPPGYEGKYGLDADGDGYTDNWFKRQWQKLVHGPYQRFNLESPHLQPGDGQLRTGQTGLEGYRNAAGQTVELIGDVTKEVAIQLSTMGLGGWLSKFDDVNDMRRAAQQQGKFAAPFWARLQKLKPFTPANFRENLSIVTGILPANAQAHHVFPRNFQQLFKSKGIDVHNPAFGAWWDSHDHVKNWKRYQDRWEEFFETKPTKNQILDFGRKLGGEFGFDVFY